MHIFTLGMMDDSQYSARTHSGCMVFWSQFWSQFTGVIAIITVKLLVAKADHQQLIIWQFCFWAAQQVESVSLSAVGTD